MCDKVVEDAYKSGCAALIANRFEDAVAQFDSVANRLEWFESNDNIDVILKILSNRGLSHIKLRNDSAAIEDFTNLLDRIDIYRYLRRKDNIEVSSLWEELEVKTLMRRASCLENIGEFQRALIDLRTLQTEHTEVFRKSTALQSQFVRVEHRIKDDASAAKLDGRPGWMAHAHQSLRLSLIRSLPQRLTCFQPFTCRLALGNELGLFDRNLFLALDSHSSTLNGVTYRVRCEPFALDRQLQSLVPRLQVLCQDEPGNGDATDATSVPLGKDGKAVMHLMFNGEDVAPQVDHVDILLRFSISSTSESSTKAQDVLPVISIPLKLYMATATQQSIVPAPTASTMIELVASIAEMRVNCLRPITLPSFLIAESVAGGSEVSEILCGESVGLLGIGGKIWDSTFVLIRYLYQNRLDLVSGKRILELGAGTGITSLALSRLQPAMVVCTDLEEVVPLIKVNVELNAAWSPSLRSVLRNDYFVQPLSWGGEFLPPAVGGADVRSCEVIIASDVVYYPEGYEPLLTTLESLLCLPSDAGLSKCCILAHRHRHPEDHRFFSMLFASLVLQVEELMWRETLFNAAVSTSQALQDVRLFRISAKTPLPER